MAYKLNPDGKPFDPHNVVTNRLPTKDEECRRAQLMEDMFSTTTRAGAGGTRPGVFGLRPRGGRNASNFIDYLTPGKTRKQQPRFSEPLKEPQGFQYRDIPQKVRVILPRNFCPDCDRTDRPPEGGAINLNFFAEARDDLDIPPNSIMFSFFCQECVEKFRANVNDKSKELELVTGGTSYNKGQMDSAARLVRVKKNTEDFIRHCIMTGRQDIFVKDQ